jgi:hypothetical protein
MKTREILLLLAAATLLCPSLARAQDSQSLGDAARQARLQKHEKDAKAKDAPTPANAAQPATPPKKVVTNDDIPEHVGSTLTSPSRTSSSPPDYVPQSHGPRKLTAEQWKTLIQAAKNALASQQRQIDRLSELLQHPETCIADCAQRNERQREKEVQLDAMKAQLGQRQKMLEELQDAARKQGFGNAVYDP